jgi:23S rRNA G2069 N7-methylase RlmK/C1962 C5-methylase RlmI
MAGVGAFYRRIGRALAGRWRGYTAWILAGNLEAAGQFGLKPAASLPLRNGPIDCRLLKFELAGSSSESTVRPSGAGPSATRSSPAEALRNRLARMGKHWARWARRQEISCYRLYDGDLPEVPWTIDRYQDRLHIVEHESPHGRSPLEHREWFEALLGVVGEVLGVTAENIHAHPDEKATGPAAYKERTKAVRADRFVVTESGHRVEVDLGRRDDTGLVPEMRTLRERMAAESPGLRFLNLFGRSGGASLFAGAEPGNARSTITLVPSGGFARWAEHNFELNHLSEPDHVIIQADPIEWIERMAQAQATPLDLMLVAPPAGFHRRSDTRAWNPREEYRQLLDSLQPLLAERGRIYFVSSVRRFRLDPADLPWASTRDVSAQMLPADCRTKPRLRIWSLVRAV